MRRFGLEVLGGAFFQRKKGKREEILREAISCFEEAMCDDPSSSRVTRCLMKLWRGSSGILAFTGIGDLTKAIKYLSQAAERVRLERPNRANMLWFNMI